MALVFLLSWHYSVPVMFCSMFSFLVRKCSCPVLQWENTDCISVELFQESSTGNRTIACLCEPFKANFLSQELMNVSRNDVLIYPPCSWHLSWRQRSTGRILVPWGTCSCALQRGGESMPRATAGCSERVPCRAALCHTPAAPFSNHFTHGSQKHSSKACPHRVQHNTGISTHLGSVPSLKPSLSSFICKGARTIFSPPVGHNRCLRQCSRKKPLATGSYLNENLN